MSNRSIASVRAENNRPGPRISWVTGAITYSKEDALEAAFSEQDMDIIDDTVTERLYVAWRLLRCWVRDLNMLGPSDPLAMLKPEQWKELSPYANFFTFDRWVLRCNRFSKRLALEHTLAGSRGMAGIASARYCKEAWPGAEEIQGYEKEVMWRCLTPLTELPPRRCLEAIREGFQVTLEEAKHLRGLALKFSRALTRMSKEETLSLAVLRTEEARFTATVNGDHRGELNALKQLSMIQGLTRHDPADEMRDFTDMVKDLDARERLRISPPE